MTAAVLHRPTWRERGLHRPAALACLVTAPLTLLAGGDALVARGLLAVAVGSAVVVVACRDRVLVVAGALGWLAVLGFARRLLIPFTGWSQYDPLLLLAPATAIVVLVVARGRVHVSRTALSSFVAFQLLWVVAQITNPDEPGVVVAAQGALFFVAPLLWFFVGRSLSARAHAVLHRTILWTALPIVALGLWHTFVGLLPFELTWLAVADAPPSLVFVRGFHIRPFSMLSSPQEYGVVLTLVALVLLVRVLHAEPTRRLRWATALVVVLLTLFLQGSRGIFLTFVVVAAIVVAVHRRSLIGPFLVVATVAALAFVGSLGADLSVGAEDAITQERSSTAQSLLRHQLEGLADPGNTTLGLHIEIAAEGFREGLHNPLGRGPSNHRIQDFDDPNAQFSPETELALTMAALGLPGAIALVGIYVTGLTAAVRLYRRVPDALHLTWLALLLGAGDQAFNGRLYFASAIAALTYGGLAAAWAAERSRSTRG